MQQEILGKNLSLILEEFLMLKQAADPTMCVASFNGTRTVQTFY